MLWGAEIGLDSLQSCLVSRLPWQGYAPYYWPKLLGKKLGELGSIPGVELHLVSSAEKQMLEKVRVTRPLACVFPTAQGYDVTCLGHVVMLNCFQVASGIHSRIMAAVSWQEVVDTQSSS